MSSQSEGEQPDQAPAPLEQFDAFRARQADDRAQQQTQGSYSFPPEYAADPPGQLGSAPAPPGGRVRGSAGRPPGGRLRSIVILGGAVVLAVAVGFGAYAAVGSSGPAANVTTSGGGTPTPGAAATATSAAKHGRAVDVRVVIESIGTDSFTGHLVATGEEVTVQLDGTTRFGTAAHPFSRGQLSVGETVLVRGRRSAADTLSATVVVGG